LRITKRKTLCSSESDDDGHFDGTLSKQTEYDRGQVVTAGQAQLNKPDLSQQVPPAGHQDHVRRKFH
jgi:hypothetical protein